MSNSFGGLLWTIDTTGAITTERVSIGRMRWRPNAKDDTLLVADKNGNKLWEEKALELTPLGDVSWEPPRNVFGPYNGMTVTISAGTLYVELRG